MFKDGIFSVPPVVGEVNPKFSKGGFSKTLDVNAETQKAKGVFFLQNKKAIVSDSYGWDVPKHLLFRAGMEFDNGSFNFPVFARPCPTVPKHGFVDSTICNNADELNALSKETYRVEEKAELLITKPVDSSFNAIINGGVITFAPGNDGATSGRGVRYFYISEDPLSNVIGLDPSLLLEGEVPFYEMVFSETGEASLVQVRSAPGVPRAKDFIPHRVTVKRIIKAEGDLIEWEEKMAGADSEGTIIDHTGGSLSSHYAIHSIVNKIPIFTTYCPEIGDVVEATVESSEITPKDRSGFKEAFVAGFNSAPFVYKNLNFLKSENARPILNGILELSLATLHNFSALSEGKDFETLGLVLGLFVRTTFSVSSGEARHSNQQSGFESSYKFAEKMENFFKECSSDREACYNTMFSKDSAGCIENIETIYYIFKDLGWSSSYGGYKWASCTASSIQLFNACVRGDIEQVVSLFNRVINEEHNGGKYLNKIIDISQFDDVASDPSGYALKKLSTIIDILYTAWRYRDEKESDWRSTESAFVEIEIEPLQLPIVNSTSEDLVDAEVPLQKVSTVLCGMPDCGVASCENCKSYKCGKKSCEKCFPEEIESVLYMPSSSEFADSAAVYVVTNIKKTLRIKVPNMKNLKPYQKLFNKYSKYWWTTYDGEKVISKAKLSSEIKKIKKNISDLNGNYNVASLNKDQFSSDIKKIDLSCTMYNSAGSWSKVKIFMGDNSVISSTLKNPVPGPKHFTTKLPTISLVSAPGWWCLPNGEKVISKIMVNKILNEHKCSYEAKTETLLSLDISNHTDSVKLFFENLLGTPLYSSKVKKNKKV